MRSAGSQSLITTSQVSQPVLPIFGGALAFPFESYLLIGGLLETWLPEAGQIYTAEKGSVPNEGGFVTYRSGAIKYVFSPPYLRTVYKLNYLTLNLPPIRYTQVKTKEGAKEELEIEYTIGWLAVVKIAGTSVFTTEVISSNFTLLSVEGIGGNATFTLQPRVNQVQFTADITAIPGTSIEVNVLPFLTVDRIIKNGKFEGGLGAVFDGSLKPILNTSIFPAVLVYDKEFVK